MSDEEDGFLQRWARRKAEARRAQDAPEDPPAPLPEPEPEEVAFDPTSLPPLESLGAASDYTAFLKAGVPKALRRAALRRAWASDPAITGHKPLVDYDWDCNAPGYGALWPGDDPRKLVEVLFRHLREPQPEEEGPPETPEAPPAEIAQSAETDPAASESLEPPAPTARTEEAPAPAHPQEIEKPRARIRTHGRAIPS